MGDAPPNIPVEIVDALINDVLKGLGLSEAYTLLVAAFPFLGWPIIGLVTSFLISWVGGAIFKALEKLVSFKVIDWEVIAQNDAYKASLQTLEAAQATGDAAQLEAAKAQFKANLQKLIHY
jgi:Arc/MetJ family transcription regulator